MKRIALILALCLAAPAAFAAGNDAEPHPDNDTGFALGVYCAPFFEPLDQAPVFDNMQGNHLAVNLPLGVDDVQDDYARFLCDSDASGNLTAGDAIVCCKRHNGREIGDGSSVNCRSFQLVVVIPVDEDGDGALDYYLVSINPNGPPNACAGIKQSNWTKGSGTIID